MRRSCVEEAKAKKNAVSDVRWTNEVLGLIADRD